MMFCFVLGSLLRSNLFVVLLHMKIADTNGTKGSKRGTVCCNNDIFLLFFACLRAHMYA